MPLALSEAEPSVFVVVLRLPLTTVETVSVNVTVPVGVPLPPPFVTVAVKVTGTPAGSVRSSGFDEVTLTPTPLRSLHRYECRAVDRVGRAVGTDDGRNVLRAARSAEIQELRDANWWRRSNDRDCRRTTGESTVLVAAFTANALPSHGNTADGNDEF